MPINFIQQYLRERNSGQSSLGFLQLFFGTILAGAFIHEAVEGDSEIGLGCLCLGVTLATTGALTLFVSHRAESQIQFSWLGRDPNPLQISYQKALGVILITAGLASLTTGYLTPTLRAVFWGIAIGTLLSGSLNQSYAIGRWDEERKRLAHQGELRECFRQEDLGYALLGLTKSASGVVLLTAGILGLWVTNIGSQETTIVMASLGMAITLSEILRICTMNANDAKLTGLVYLVTGFAFAILLLPIITPLIREISWGITTGFIIEAITNLSYAAGRWDEQKRDPENIPIGNPVLAPEPVLIRSPQP